MGIKFDFQGKNVLISGASTGIGKTTALEFAKAGANVIVADFNEDEGKKTAQECSDLGTNSKFYHTDVSNEDAVQAMAKQVLSDYGYVDFMLSNAGVSGKKFGNPFKNLDPKDIRHVFEVNVMGFVNMVQAFYDNFATRKQGKIVVTSSVAAFQSVALIPHYAASKLAVLSFMRSVALEMGRYNVNVNAIAPGYVYTPIYYDAIKFKTLRPEVFGKCETSEEVMNLMASASPLRRPQTEMDMANAMMFLCSEAADNITGHCLTIDSGKGLM